jgi:SAM-dependent methyltransferase
MIVCKICLNEKDNRFHKVREMMFGFREYFDYLECGQCGCLQLLEIPMDMSKYYLSDYYSFQSHGRLKTFIRQQWAAHSFGKNKNPLGWLISRVYSPKQSVLSVVRAGVPKTGRILDVGCGSGRLLLDLAYLGFTDLSGVDPFIDREVQYENGPIIFKKELKEFKGDFDLVMLHHTFEHMDQPLETLLEIRRLLSSRGKAILRIPVASSFAWHHFGVNWVNLDAPRHFFLHTFESIKILGMRAGFLIDEIVHEGTGEQFWLSEQYARDIPLNDPRSLAANLLKRMLAWKKIRNHNIRADELNRKRQSDLVCIHMQKL